MAKQPFFITGTGTHIGKTFVACTLIKEALAAGYTVRALKPLVSGAENGRFSDTEKLLKASGMPITDTSINGCSPWRFTAPLAPSMAATLEQKNIIFEEIVDFCRQAMHQADITFIEGAGGLMSPVTETTTHIDWIKALNIPVILVGGSYLGAISHMLTTLTACTYYGISVDRIVISQTSPQDIPLEDTISALRPFINKTPCIGMPYCSKD